MTLGTPADRTAPPADTERTTASFRDAMSRLACGVVMVTCDVSGRPWGLTVSACCSVSLDPPTLLVSVGAGTVSAGAIRETGRFGVSILSHDAHGAAVAGAATGVPKFVDEYCAAGTPERTARTPVIDGCIAHVDCELTQAVEVGDHVVLFGTVQAVHDADPVLRAAPLLYYDRAFRGLDHAPVERHAA